MQPRLYLGSAGPPHVLSDSDTAPSFEFFDSPLPQQTPFTLLQADRPAAEATSTFASHTSLPDRSDNLRPPLKLLDTQDTESWNKEGQSDVSVMANPNASNFRSDARSRICSQRKWTVDQAQCSEVRTCLPFQVLSFLNLFMVRSCIK